MGVGVGIQAISAHLRYRAGRVVCHQATSVRREHVRHAVVGRKHTDREVWGGGGPYASLVSPVNINSSLGGTG